MRDDRQKINPVNRARINRQQPAVRVEALELLVLTRREVDEPAVSSGVPVGTHLADQLMLPLALAGEGRYRTTEPTPHSRTNAEVIRQFLDTELELTALDDGTWEVRV